MAKNPKNLKMLEPNPNYRGEQVQFDDLEPPAPRDQIDGIEPGYAKPYRGSISDRIKQYVDEVPERLQERVVETKQVRDAERQQRRAYNKARVAFASANRLKMDRSIDTRFWIDGETYIDVDPLSPDAVKIAQAEILRVRAKPKRRPAPTTPWARSPTPQQPPRHQPSFDFIAGTGGAGRPPQRSGRPPSDAGLSFVAGGFGRPPAPPSRRQPPERSPGMSHLAGFLGGGARSQPQRKKGRERGGRNNLEHRFSRTMW